MNFDFSSDERMIAEQTARLLGDQCGMDVVREVLEGRQDYARGVWQQLGEMGLHGTALPEAYGGVGATYGALCLVAQELGRAVAPVPFSTSVYLVAEAVNRLGTEAQKQSLLPGIASGATIGTLAVTETTEQLTEASVATKEEGGKLYGEKLVVPYGAVADCALVLARGSQGVNLYVADLSSGVTSQAVETVDPTMGSASLTFDGAAAELLGAEGDGWRSLQQVYQRAAVLYAFEQIGGAQAALDMAVGYANERFAFGRAIGSFQALKHMMADMYVALKLAESNCYYAAWALDADSDELPLAAATARVSATQAYQLCSRDNIQVHGGMGFTWEFDCHLYYRRSNYQTLLLGGLTEWQNHLVEALPRTATAA